MTRDSRRFKIEEKIGTFVGVYRNVENREAMRIQNRLANQKVREEHELDPNTYYLSQEPEKQFYLAVQTEL